MGKIQEKIKEYQQRQAELIQLLQLLQNQGDNEENLQKLGKTNSELASISFQISRLYAAIPLADKTQEILDTIPSLDEIKEVAEECTTAAIEKASEFFHSVADKIGSLGKGSKK